jgi:hypothetical protein
MANRSDNFNRADSYPTALGTPSDGGSDWISLVGGWGVESNQARSTSGANTSAVLECAESDGTVSAKFYSISQAALAFRCSDANNLITVFMKPGEMTINTFIAGTYSPVGPTYAYSHTPGDTIAAILSGSSVSVTLNGTQVIAPQTIAFNQSATKHGLLTYTDTTVRFDDFAFSSGGGSSLTAGATSFVSSGPSGISISATDATNGTAPYTYQWQRNADSGSYTNLTNGSGVTGATTLTLLDGSAVSDVLYGYRCVYTDNSSATATSNIVTAVVYEGGAIGSGVIYFAY